MAVAKRARSPKQKNERRREILEAALARFRSRPFQDISMDAVARSAGMAKGTVFLYFKTKEALFLNLTAREFKSMFDALEEKLAALAASRLPVTRERVMNLMQEVLGRREILMRLIAIQSIVLEQNISYEEARTFKMELTRRVLAVGERLDRMVPFFAKGQGARFVVWMYAFVIGFAHVAEPAPVIRKVYAREPLARRLKPDFATEYFSVLNAVWEGWRVLSPGKKTSGKTGGNHGQ
jgi:TetR/AcrR family transcriptional regulator